MQSEGVGMHPGRCDQESGCPADEADQGRGRAGVRGGQGPARHAARRSPAREGVRRGRRALRKGCRVSARLLSAGCPHSGVRPAHRSALACWRQRSHAYPSPDAIGPAKGKPPVVAGTSADSVASPAGKATPPVRGPLGGEIRPAEVAEGPSDFHPPGAGDRPGPGSAGPARGAVSSGRNSSVLSTNVRGQPGLPRM